MSKKELEPINCKVDSDNLQTNAEGEAHRVDIECLQPFMVDGQMAVEGQEVRGIPEVTANGLVQRGRAKHLSKGK